MADGLPVGIVDSTVLQAESGGDANLDITRTRATVLGRNCLFGDLDTLGLLITSLEASASSTSTVSVPISVPIAPTVVRS